MPSRYVAPSAPTVYSVLQRAHLVADQRTAVHFRAERGDEGVGAARLVIRARARGEPSECAVRLCLGRERVGRIGKPLDDDRVDALSVVHSEAVLAQIGREIGSRRRTLRGRQQGLHRAVVLGARQAANARQDELVAGNAAPVGARTSRRSIGG